MKENAKCILDIINTSNSHMTAEEIYLEMKKRSHKVVLATVYNNLHSLHEKGLIQKVTVEGSPDRYDRMERHDHLVCKRCGALTDIYLEDITESLKDQLNQDFISYDLRVNYICEDCRNQEN